MQWLRESKTSMSGAPVGYKYSIGHLNCSSAKGKGEVVPTVGYRSTWSLRGGGLLVEASPLPPKVVMATTTKAVIPVHSFLPIFVPNR